MKNIKIFDSDLFKKGKIRLATFAMATTMAITGTVSFNNSNKEVPETVPITYMMELEEEELLDTNTKKVNTLVNDNFLNTKVTIDKESLDEYIEKVNSIEVEYEDSDLFNAKQALEEYYKLGITDTKNQKAFRINKDGLYNTVIKNNEEFFENRKISSYKKLDEKNIRKITDAIADNINDKIDKGLITNYDELKYNINNLKVTSFSGFGGGIYSEEDGVLGIQLSVAQSHQKDNPNINALNMLTEHESEHIMQVTINSNIPYENVENITGMSYKFKNMDVNPLFSKWLYEGAAEKEVLNNYDDDRKPLTYENNILGLDCLNTTVLLKKEADPQIVEHLNYQHNLDKLFELFDATTEDEKIEIVNMLYAFQINNSNDSEFKKVYKEKYGKIDYSEYGKYKEHLKSSIALTLSKKFYINLAKSLDSNTTYNDMYSLIAMFEDQMIRLLRYNSEYKNLDDFASQYNEIKEEFFNYISNSNTLSSNDMTLQYNEYYLSKAPYKNITWLDTDKNNYIQKIEQDKINRRSRIIEKNIQKTHGVK